MIENFITFGGNLNKKKQFFEIFTIESNHQDNY